MTVLEIREKVRTLCFEGRPHSALALLCGLDHDVVRQHVRELDRPLRSAYQLVLNQCNKIRAEVLDKLSEEKIDEGIRLIKEAGRNDPDVFTSAIVIDQVIIALFYYMLSIGMVERARKFIPVFDLFSAALADEARALMMYRISQFENSETTAERYRVFFQAIRSAEEASCPVKPSSSPRTARSLLQQAAEMSYHEFREDLLRHQTMLLNRLVNSRLLSDAQEELVLAKQRFPEHDWAPMTRQLDEAIASQTN